MFWQGFIANVGLRGSANESGDLTRPDVKFAGLGGRFNAEVAQVALAIIDGLVVATHSIMVIDLLSPKSLIKVVDNLLNKSANWRWR